jgi:hypothetical protein
MPEVEVIESQEFIEIKRVTVRMRGVNIHFEAHAILGIGAFHNLFDLVQDVNVRSEVNHLETPFRYVDFCATTIGRTIERRSDTSFSCFSFDT